MDATTDLPTNWGRWGDDDERGTLNLIDDAAAARAAAEISSGRHVSLARPVTPVSLTTGLGPVAAPAMMPAPVLQTVNFSGMRPMAMTDALFINTHNAALTHVDAVSHMPIDGVVYPGVPLDKAVTPIGVRHGSANPIAAGVLTRGILLDLAPGASLDAEFTVTADVLQAALDATGATLQPGDAVVVRGGWDPNQPMHLPIPGLDLGAVRWLHEHDVSIYIGDIADRRPMSPPLAVHQVGLARLGMPLIDAADLDDLAAACRAEGRHTFMLVIAPPRITGTTGLPVNPIAVF